MLFVWAIPAIYIVNSGVGTERSASMHSSTPNLLVQNAKSVPLGKAAENGHTQSVKRLLEGGANRNHQDKVNMHTKLHSSSSQCVAHGLTLHVSPPVHVYSLVTQHSTMPLEISMQM